MRNVSSPLLWTIAGALCGAGLAFFQPLTATAQTPSDGAATYRFSGPYVHKNLSIYLIHGKDRFESGDILTLDEALEQRKVIVHETGDVSELSIENVSDRKSVFVHAGDIVKGGKQDRVLTYDLLLQPRSGKVPIASFCVEQGRWQARGVEEVSTFDSSKMRLASKALKLAAQSDRMQERVWEEVTRMQRKLRENVDAPVRAAASETSLQLSLESAPVVRSTKGYRETLADVVDTADDAIGFAFTINGALNSAEVYGARALFVRLWPKLLESIASEAVAEQKSGKEAAPPFSEAELTGFLRGAERAPVRENKKTDITEVQHRESNDAVYFETRSSRHDADWLHRGYVKK